MKNILFAIIFAVVLHLCHGQGVVVPELPPPAPNDLPPPPPLVGIVGSETANPQTPKLVLCSYNSVLPTTRTDKYSLADVDSSLCTHVIYNSVSLDGQTLTIKPESLGADFENVIGLKQKGVGVILSLGGSADPDLNEKLSRMVNDGAARAQFVKATLLLMQQRKIDGLDINWNFPGRLGRRGDRGNFVNLLRDFSAAFQHNKFLLTVTVSPLTPNLENAYNILGIARSVNYINLLTYDMHDPSFTKTAIHSPFNGNVSSLIQAIDYWKSKGAPANKIIVGIPTYGRTFTLALEANNTVGSPAAIGKTTTIQTPGMAAYFEVCTGLNYQLVENVGSYAYKGDQWVSFDDINSIKLKGEYIKKNKLAGALITSLDTDDYSGTLCNQGKYPLIKALRGALELK